MKLKVSSCLQVRKLGILLASSGLFLKAMPNLSDISCFQQVQKELIRISPKPYFDLYSREDYSKTTFPSQGAGTGEGLCVFSTAGASVWSKSCVILAVNTDKTRVLHRHSSLVCPRHSAQSTSSCLSAAKSRTGLLREQYLSSFSCLNSKYINSKAFHLDKRV